MYMFAQCIYAISFPGRSVSFCIKLSAFVSNPSPTTPASLFVYEVSEKSRIISSVPTTKSSASAYPSVSVVAVIVEVTVEATVEVAVEMSRE